VAQEWYYTVKGEQVGPVSPAELKKAATEGTLQPTDLVWKEGMAEWVEAQSIKGLFASPTKSAESVKTSPQKSQIVPEEEDQIKIAIRKGNQDDEDYEEEEEEEERPRKKTSIRSGNIPRFNREEVKSKKTVAAILALLLGGYGIHKFYLGKTTAGIITILACCGGFGIIPLIEFIIYLTKSEEDFYKDYIVGDKEWF
jgi:TM2 domain-containing membrane protein YozV